LDFDDGLGKRGGKKIRMGEKRNNSPILPWSKLLSQQSIILRVLHLPSWARGRGGWECKKTFTGSSYCSQLSKLIFINFIGQGQT